PHHDQKGQALVLADIEYRDDVGVAETAGRACLAQKALPTLEIAGVAFAQHLDCKVPVDMRVEGLVDDRHRAAPQLTLDLVTSDSLHGDLWSVAHEGHVSAFSPLPQNADRSEWQPSRRERVR